MNSWSRIEDMQFEAHLCATNVMEWWETNFLKGEKTFGEGGKKIRPICL
jgi:hypothetical protein